MSNNEDVVIGVIEQITPRTTDSWGTMYDVEVNGKRYGHGKVKPPFVPGDCVKFSVIRKGQYLNVRPGTMEKHDVAQSTPATAVLTAIEKAPATYASKEDSRQNSIVLQSARKDAIEVTKLLLQADAAGIKAKDTWATKHDLLLGLINDLTRRFYHNVIDWKEFVGPTPAKIAPVAGTVTQQEEEEQ